MRILSNDFGGYPYPVQLARELARRGHDVLHTHCASLTTTPGGATAPRTDDPAGFETRGLALARPLEKYNFGRRFLQEREYGRLVAAAARAFRPDVVLSANTPLDAQAMLLRETRRQRARFVFWLQDIIGIAAERILRAKIPVAGALVGQHYVRLEARLLRQSDHVVTITDDFAPILRGWGVAGRPHDDGRELGAGRGAAPRRPGRRVGARDRAGPGVRLPLRRHARAQAQPGPAARPRRRAPAGPHASTAGPSASSSSRRGPGPTTSAPRRPRAA